MINNLISKIYYNKNIVGTYGLFIYVDKMPYNLENHTILYETDLRTAFLAYIYACLQAEMVNH